VDWMLTVQGHQFNDGCCENITKQRLSSSALLCNVVSKNGANIAEETSTSIFSVKIYQLYMKQEAALSPGCKYIPTGIQGTISQKVSDVRTSNPTCSL